MSRKAAISFLDRIAAMPWSKAKKELQANIHMVALENGVAARDVLETFRGEAGIKAAIAVLAAHWYLMKHGYVSTVYKAIDLYWQCAKEAATIPKLKKQAVTLECELRNLEYMVYFAGHVEPKEWPFVPEFDNINEKAGIANVMMLLAVRELSKDGSTTAAVASMGIMRFLEDGMKRKGKKAVAG